MLRPQQLLVRSLTTSHCIPEEPVVDSPKSAAPSLSYSSSSSLDDPEEPVARPRRASTRLISQSTADVQRLLGEAGTKLVEKCCGGGCCMELKKTDSMNFERVPLPDNDAFRAMQLKVDVGLIPTALTETQELPAKTISILPVDKAAPVLSPTESAILMGEATDNSIDFTPHGLESRKIDTSVHPPSFVQPHPPFNVHSAKLFNARPLTKEGAEKPAWHFDIDVTDYPTELGVDFLCGGAIGVMVPNEASIVDELMDLLLIPRRIRDKPILLKTQDGHWPTVWGEEQARELITTRRDLLTWCTDIQSAGVSKPLLRLLAEHATDSNEKKILMYICSAEGEAYFCAMRNGPYLTLAQLLHAFPSTKPPLADLFATLKQLVPRFYSLSSDPSESCVPRSGCARIIQIAVSIHETNDWRGGQRTGVGSGFFERQALKFVEAEAKGQTIDLRIPMFKGLMKNPLATEVVSDGPMLLVGAGVGVAPFRGFVQRRLKNASCANKVWVLQGIRDSLLDELYSGEWGVNESEVKKVVQSRKSSGKGKYVQDEVRAQADLVWFIINSIDGRVFVCGSTRGMGEGVDAALVDVAMSKGNLSHDEALEFWRLKRESKQYIAETW